jgi:hypothetical protein
MMAIFRRFSIIVWSCLPLSISKSPLQAGIGGLPGFCCRRKERSLRPVAGEKSHHWSSFNPLPD